METVVITGGCSGIGLATAQAFLKEGYRVYALDMHAPDTLPAGLLFVECDVTKGASVEKAVATIDGTVDMLFNNAGLMRRGSLLESSEEDFDLLFAVHVKGAWLLTKHLLPKLAKDALILQMSSVHALRASTDPGIYTLTKQAAVHFAEMLRKAYPDFRVKIIFPGPTDTPLARHGVAGEALKEKEKVMNTPEEVAGQIVELSKSDALRLVYRDEHRDYVLE